MDHDEPERDATPAAPEGADAALLARIVCGVDRSEASLDAVRQVRRLALPSSEIVLVAVSETRLAVHAGMQAPRVAHELDAEAHAALESASSLAGEAEVRFVGGRPDEALLDVAADEQATLVAVGSHGWRRWTGILLGSVATRMLHDAPCSVLVARRHPEPAPAFPHAIVTGVDGSPSSLQAAAVAASLGERLGVAVAYLAATGSSRDIDLALLAESGVEAERSEAKPVPALVEAAARADLLVLGSRGLLGLRSLGSVSQRVAHRASSSLLVVRGNA